MGTAAVQAKLDPRIVDAMRSIQALENGEEVPQLAYEDRFAEDVQPNEDEEEIHMNEPRKRSRIDNALQSDDDHPNSSSPPSGLLTAETMDGLKYFAQLRQARGGTTRLAATAPTAPTPAKGLGGLGDYGSDEEDD